MALTSQETIDLYLVLNKMIYKHAGLGKDIFGYQRNPDMDNYDAKLMLEVAIATELLLEPGVSIIQEGTTYPNFANIEGTELESLLSFFTTRFSLDPVPYMDFPKNTTTYIKTEGSLNVNGTQLPAGGGPNFYLTKNLSGNLIWKEIENINSEFNLL